MTTKDDGGPAPVEAAMSDAPKFPLRIYTEPTSQLGGLWAFKPFAMVHVEWVPLSDALAHIDAAADLHTAALAARDARIAAMTFALSKSQYACSWAKAILRDYGTLAVGPIDTALEASRAMLDGGKG